MIRTSWQLCIPLALRLYGTGTFGLLFHVKYNWTPMLMCIFGISLLYVEHAIVWYYPMQFAKLSASITNRNPTDTVAFLEILGKFWQAFCIYKFLGQNVSIVVHALLRVPSFVAVVGILQISIGQILNFAVYSALGNSGVYYGYRMGIHVPWCNKFPFNIGLRHPQYTGVVLTLLGGAFVLVDEACIELGLIHIILSWCSMYAVMAYMEQIDDNDNNR